MRCTLALVRQPLAVVPEAAHLAHYAQAAVLDQQRLERDVVDVVLPPPPKQPVSKPTRQRRVEVRTSSQRALEVRNRRSRMTKMTAALAASMARSFHCGKRRRVSADAARKRGVGTPLAPRRRRTKCPSCVRRTAPRPRQEREKKAIYEHSIGENKPASECLQNAAAADAEQTRTHQVKIAQQIAVAMTPTTMTCRL